MPGNSFGPGRLGGKVGGTYRICGSNPPPSRADGAILVPKVWKIVGDPFLKTGADNKA